MEYVEINGQQLEYMQHFGCKFTITLCHGVFRILSVSSATSASSSLNIALPCKEMSNSQRAQVKFLYEQGHALPNMERPGDHRILCREREGRRAEPESDGEDISDPPICPSFSEEELVIVRYSREGDRALQCCWKTVCGCTGVLRQPVCHRNCRRRRISFHVSSQYLNWLSTTWGAVSEVVPAKALRSSGDSSSSPLTVVTKERYADCIVYDSASVVNVVVTEVKKDEDSAIELNRWWGCDGKGNE